MKKQGPRLQEGMLPSVSSQPFLVDATHPNANNRHRHFNHMQISAANRALQLEKTSQPLLQERQRRDPFQDIGNTAEYRGTQCRAGIKGPSRPRRWKKKQFRKGNKNHASTIKEGTKEVEKEGSSSDQRRVDSHRVQERPVYWKLLQKVLENLGLPEEQ